MIFDMIIKEIYFIVVSFVVFNFTLKCDSNLLLFGPNFIFSFIHKTGIFFSAMKKIKINDFFFFHAGFFFFEHVFDRLCQR